MQACACCLPAPHPPALMQARQAGCSSMVWCSHRSCSPSSSSSCCPPAAGADWLAAAARRGADGAEVQSASGTIRRAGGWVGGLAGVGGLVEAAFCSACSFVLVVADCVRYCVPSACTAPSAPLLLPSLQAQRVLSILLQHGALPDDSIDFLWRLTEGGCGVGWGGVGGWMS